MVRTYIRRCILERQVDLIDEDIQDLLETGMRNTDTSLPSLSNERLIDRLVEVCYLPRERSDSRCGGHFLVQRYPISKLFSFPSNNFQNSASISEEKS